MKLLTKEIERKLPPIGATENQADPIIRVKFFTPDSFWTWYGIEYDPKERLFFGLVRGFEEEMGYFSLAELEHVRGPLGLPIERDKFWDPVPISKVRTKLNTDEFVEGHFEKLSDLINDLPGKID